MINTTFISGLVKLLQTLGTTFQTIQSKFCFLLQVGNIFSLVCSLCNFNILQHAQGSASKSDNSTSRSNTYTKALSSFKWKQLYIKSTKFDENKQGNQTYISIVLIRNSIHGSFHTPTPHYIYIEHGLYQKKAIIHKVQFTEEQTRFHQIH